MERPWTRRSFCQLTLAAACACAAGANPAVRLRGEFLPRLQGDVMLVELKLHNESGHPVDVLILSGSHPVIDVSASWGSWEARMQPDEKPRELLLRSGPRRSWQPLPAGGQLAAGVYRLAVPPEGKQSLRDTPAEFRATVETGSGSVIVTSSNVRVAVSP